MTCGDVREALGVLALGALDRRQESAVREHLAQCPRCAAEYSELEPVVRLLDLAPVEQIDPAPSRQTDDHLWDALVGRITLDRRSRRRRGRLAAAGAVVAAGLLGVLGGVVIGGDADAPTPTVAPAKAVSARDADTGVHAEVSVRKADWGTALTVQVGGVTPGEQCSLIAVGRDGSPEVAASWRVPEAGYGQTGVITVPGGAGMALGEIDRFEIVTADGETLLQVPAAGHAN